MSKIRWNIENKLYHPSIHKSCQEVKKETNIKNVKNLNVICDEQHRFIS